jgi:hypothetical protein
VDLKMGNLLRIDRVLGLLLLASSAVVANGCLMSFPDYAEGDLLGSGGRPTTVEPGSGGSSATARDASTPDALVGGAAGGGAVTTGGNANGGTSGRGTSGAPGHGKH